MNPNYLLDIIYLFASLTFVLGLKMLSNPDSARRGNLVAAVGMTLAIIGTIVLHQGDVPFLIYILIFSAILIGTISGWVTAKRVQMTKMPELVSLFNGMGGACAGLIGLIEFHHNVGNTSTISIIIAGMIIGSVSFSGSMIAWAKLNGTMKKALRLPRYNMINNLILLSLVIFGIYIPMSGTDSQMLLFSVFALALFYGVMFVVPIGGADMPVVISLLNSFNGRFIALHITRVSIVPAEPTKIPPVSITWL